MSGQLSKEERVKRDAAILCDKLGMMGMIGVTVLGSPTSAAAAEVRTPSSFSCNLINNKNDQGDDKVSQLLAELDSRSSALFVVQEQLSSVSREKGQLVKKCDALQKSAAAAGRGGGTGGSSKLEFEKAFEQQERILRGYQKEGEKAMREYEVLQRRYRRLTDFLCKVYGSEWEKDIAQQLDRRISSSSSSISSSSSSLLPSSLCSPNLRGGFAESVLVGRSIGQTPRRSFSSFSTPLRNVSNGVLEEGGERGGGNGSSSEMDLQEQGAEVTTTTTMMSTERADELEQHLAAVQDLIRGMERRLVERDMELDELVHSAEAGVVEMQASI